MNFSLGITALSFYFQVGPILEVFGSFWAIFVVGVGAYLNTMREDMKKLKRKLMREYEKRGKSDLYFYLKNDLDEKVKSEKLKYKNKVIEEVKTGSRSSSYAAIKKLGAHPTDLIKGFTLPEHVELGMTAAESVEAIAEHFAAISSTYEPLSIENFSPNLRQKLKTLDTSVCPKLSELQVYKRICKSKKPNSNVPGDLPKKVL